MPLSFPKERNHRQSCSSSTCLSLYILNNFCTHWPILVTAVRYRCPQGTYLWEEEVRQEPTLSVSHLRDKTLYYTQRTRTREGLKAGFSESSDGRTIYFSCLLPSLSLSQKIIQIYNLILLFKARMCLSYHGVSVAFFTTPDWKSRGISFAESEANGSFDFALKNPRRNNFYFANLAFTYALSASECMDYIQTNRTKASPVHCH